MPTNFSRRSFFVSSAALALVSGTAKAAIHDGNLVEMLNKSPIDASARNVFEPRVIVVDPSEAVLFRSTDGGHNTQSMDDLIPAGAPPWKSDIGADVEITFDTSGVYPYVCTPHATAGMVGVIVVKGEGMMDNYEAAKGARYRGRARKVFGEIFDEIDAINLG
ncbi:MAG: plastocyanin/azurin family copper-binding protein [Rhodobacteraceae bacterium]|nr:plastocyanin/azurin family copper-binding protein [Paracoccaceae bacterium]